MYRLVSFQFLTILTISISNIAWWSLQASAIEPSFTPMGLLDGGTSSNANGVSYDGTVVVGWSDDASGTTRATRWTPGDGLLQYDSLQGSSAVAVSGNGNVAVGGHGPPAPWLYPSACVWTGIGQRLTLIGGSTYNYGSLSGASFDASIVVGAYFADPTDEPWSSGAVYLSGLTTTLRYLPGHAGGPNRRGDVANGVSAAGSLIVGSVLTPTPTRYRATLWTRATGANLDLGTLFGDGTNSYGEAISADGTTVVGSSTVDNYSSPAEAFRWTAGTGMVGLGDLAGGYADSVATAVSADGSHIVGYSDSANGREAFIWDENHGMRSLRDLLVYFGLDLIPWSLQVATGVSAGGETIVGYGIDPEGHTQGWIATIPEPATLVLMGLAAAWAQRTRVRKP